MRVVLNRIFGSVVAVLGASLLAFIFLRVTPGNPARLILGQFATPEAVANLTQQLGLNDPLPVQYWHYLTSFFTGDWGFSYSTGQSVASALGAKLPASIELGLYAFAFALIGAVTLALVTTYRRRRGLDASVRGFGFLALGVPQFWLGIVLMLVLSQWLGLFPGPDGRLSPGVAAPPHITGLYTVDALLSGQISTFFNAVWHLILPAFTLGVASLAFLTRLLRINLLEVSREPFLLVVESKGVPRWPAFTRHALPNASIPTLTAAGLILGQLLAGSVLVETVFHWPGVGYLITQGVLARDYSVVQTFILLSAVVYVVVNLLVDLLVVRIDPRIRLGSEDAR